MNDLNEDAKELMRAYKVKFGQEIGYSNINLNVEIDDISKEWKKSREQTIEELINIIHKSITSDFAYIYDEIPVLQKELDFLERFSKDFHPHVFRTDEDRRFIVNLTQGCDVFEVEQGPEDYDWDYDRWENELYRDHNSCVSSYIFTYVLKCLEVEKLKEEIKQLKGNKL